VALALVITRAVTARRNLDYRSSMTIWRDTLTKAPLNQRAQINWGNVLQDLGRFDEAIPHYREAVRIKPRYAEAQYNWGLALQQLGRTEEAIAHFREALRLKPGLEAARYHLRRAEAMVRQKNAPSN
jgi:tetratricopeptide (TPR) repeat protein